MQFTGGGGKGKSATSGLIWISSTLVRSQSIVSEFRVPRCNITGILLREERGPRTRRYCFIEKKLYMKATFSEEKLSNFK